MCERTRIFVLIYMALFLVGGLATPLRVRADPWPPAHPISVKGGFFTIAGEVKMLGGKQAVIEGVTVKLWKATSPDDMPLLKTTDSKGRFNFTISATAGRLELLAVKQGLTWAGGDRAVGTGAAIETRGGLAFTIDNPGVYDSFTLWMNGGTPTTTPSPRATSTRTPEPIWPTNTPVVQVTPSPTEEGPPPPPHRFTFVTIDRYGVPVNGVYVGTSYCDDMGLISGWTDEQGILTLDVPACEGPYNPFIEAPAPWQCLTIYVEGDAYEPVPTPDGGQDPCVKCFWLPLLPIQAHVTTIVWTLGLPMDTTITPTPRATITPMPSWTPTNTPIPTWTPTVTQTPRPTATPTLIWSSLSVGVVERTEGGYHILIGVPVTLYSGSIVWTVDTGEPEGYGRLGYADFALSRFNNPSEVWVRLDESQYHAVTANGYGVTVTELAPLRYELTWTGQEQTAVLDVIVEREAPTITPIPTVTPIFTPTPIPSPDVWRVYDWPVQIVVMTDGTTHIIASTPQPGMLEGR